MAAVYFVEAVKDAAGVVTKPAHFQAYPSDAAKLEAYNREMSAFLSPVKTTNFKMNTTKNGKLEFDEVGDFKTSEMQRLINGSLKKLDADGVKVIDKVATRKRTASSGTTYYDIDNFKYYEVLVPFTRETKNGAIITLEVGSIIPDTDRRGAGVAKKLADKAELEALDREASLVDNISKALTTVKLDNIDAIVKASGVVAQMSEVRNRRSATLVR